MNNYFIFILLFYF